MGELYDLEDRGMQTVSPIVEDGYGACPDCSKTLKLTASGGLRRHKCESTGESVTEVPGVRAARVVKRRGKSEAPAKVRNLGVAVIAAGVEWSSDQIISRATEIAISDLPDELDLPDADAMIAPFINLMWPQIPKGAQKALLEIADHEDLVAACFAWFQWAQTLKQFTETVQASKREDSTDGRLEVPNAPTGYAFTVADGGVNPTAIPTL